MPDDIEEIITEEIPIAEEDRRDIFEADRVVLQPTSGPVTITLPRNQGTDWVVLPPPLDENGYVEEPAEPPSHEGITSEEVSAPLKFFLRGKQYEVPPGCLGMDAFVLMSALLALEDPRVDRLFRELKCTLHINGETVWPPREETEEQDPLLLYREIMREENTPMYRIVCPTGRIADAEVYGPDGKKLSHVEVANINLDANKALASATIKINKVAIDVKASVEDPDAK